MSSAADNFFKNLERLMKKTGYSQTELGRRADQYPAVISRLMSDAQKEPAARRIPDLSTVESIATAFGITAAQMISLPDSPAAMTAIRWPTIEEMKEIIEDALMLQRGMRDERRNGALLAKLADDQEEIITYDEMIDAQTKVENASSDLVAQNTAKYRDESGAKPKRGRDRPKK